MVLTWRTIRIALVVMEATRHKKMTKTRIAIPPMKPNQRPGAMSNRMLHYQQDPSPTGNNIGAAFSAWTVRHAVATYLVYMRLAKLEADST